MEITIEGVEKAQRVTVRIEAISARAADMAYTPLRRNPLPSRDVMDSMIEEYAKRGLQPMWGAHMVSVTAWKEGEGPSTHEPVVVGDRFIGYRPKIIRPRAPSSQPTS